MEALDLVNRPYTTTLPLISVWQPLAYLMGNNMFCALSIVRHVDLCSTIQIRRPSGDTSQRQPTQRMPMRPLSCNLESTLHNKEHPKVCRLHLDVVPF